MLFSGRYDYVFPYETHQKPFIDRLGTPKRQPALRLPPLGAPELRGLTLHHVCLIVGRDARIALVSKPVRLILLASDRKR